MLTFDNFKELTNKFVGTDSLIQLYLPEHETSIVNECSTKIHVGLVSEVLSCRYFLFTQEDLYKLLEELYTSNHNIYEMIIENFQFESA